MKNIKSQISLALVCAILGFLLSYQFRILNKDQEIVPNNYDRTDIVAEIEQLKEQKEKLISENKSISEKLKGYEEAAASVDAATKAIKNELDNTRLVIGSEDVQGEGIILYLTPKSQVFSTDMAYLTDAELVYIINELNFAGAEAISVNDKRVSIQTGIKSSSNNSYILVNDEKISPRERIVIKAIGDKTNLYSALTFPGALDFNALVSYDKKYEKADGIVVYKNSKSPTYKFITPAN